MVEQVRNSGNAEDAVRRGQHESEPRFVPEIIVLDDQGGAIMSVSDKPGTLRAQMNHHEPIVCFAVKTKQIDMRTAENEAHPLDVNDDKEPQAVCYSVDALSSNSMKSKNPHSGFHKTTVSKCLDTMCCDPSCNQGGGGSLLRKDKWRRLNG